MTIPRFDTGALGSALKAYYNPTDDAPDVDGSNYITTMRPGYASVGPDLAQRDATDKAQYIAGTKVGQMEAITVREGGLVGLTGTFAEDVAFGAGSTVVMIHQFSNGNGWAYHLEDSAGNNRLGFRRNWSSDPGGYHQGILPSGAIQWSKPKVEFDEPVITVFRFTGESTQDPSRESGLFSEDTTNGYQFVTTQASSFPVQTQAINIGCSLDYTGGLNGDIGLWALYDRPLTDGEVADVMALCRVWLSTGAAPNPTYETSTSFGPVQPNDPSATLQWYCSRDGFGWVTVNTPTASGGLSNATMTNTNMTNDTLVITSGVVADSCGIKCVATTSYNPQGIESNVATLNVVETS